MRERSKIKVDLDIPKDFARLPRELETAIFRVIQECLTNIHRHSGSPVAEICLSKTDSELYIEVQDLGKGISEKSRSEMELAGRAGVGIRGMRERLRQLGGSIEIGPRQDGVGTKVTARLPLRNVLSG
jgi:signal transduction histidine kinase